MLASCGRQGVERRASRGGQPLSKTVHIITQKRTGKRERRPNGRLEVVTDTTNTKREKKHEVLISLSPTLHPPLALLDLLKKLLVTSAKHPQRQHPTFYLTAHC